MLAVVLLLMSLSALAKDAAPKSGPKIEAKATNKPGDAKEAPLQLPFPVRIIEEPPESDDAKSRADHASSNEDQDLKAQQSMASSADSQLIATYVAISFSFVGTCLLIWTVVETRKAASAAWKSVDIAQQGVTIARETAEKQLRAYVGIRKVSFEGDRRTVTISLTNSGQTPANNVTGHINWKVAQFGTLLREDFDYPDYNTGTTGSCAAFIPREETVASFAVDQALFEDVKARRTSVFIYGHYDYTDVFEKSRETTFCYQCVPVKDWVAFGAWHKHNECK